MSGASRRATLRLAALAAALSGAAAGAPGEPTLLLVDAFDGDTLDPDRWAPARVHDVRAERIAVDEGHLVVALDTVGTEDRTVKLRGVRARKPVVLGPGERLRARVVLDWNDPENGSYLTAGLALVPADAEAGAPHEAREALAFEYVGVPPGRTARPSLWRRQAGGLRPLYRAGWPEKRCGRRVGRAEVVLVVGPEEVVLREDGAERYRGPGGISGRLQLLLFVTSHSNYRERAVRFEHVRLERVRDGADDAGADEGAPPERSGAAADDALDEGEE